MKTKWLKIEVDGGHDVALLVAVMLALGLVISTL
jgi:hypothetical protein